MTSKRVVEQHHETFEGLRQFDREGNEFWLYTMTMTIHADGLLTAGYSRGCDIGGTVAVPDALHDMYGVDASASSCGSFDGRYQGMGMLADADAMQDWMAAMHPLEHGGHSHGGSMMGGSSMMGHTPWRPDSTTCSCSRW